MPKQLFRYTLSLIISVHIYTMNSALGQQVEPICVEDTRACMIATAQTYLDALVAHDASEVPFATNAKRTEQGNITAVGEKELRESTKLQPDMTEHANTRYFVDEKSKNVIAYTLLRIPGTKANPDRSTYFDGTDPVPSTVHLAERFKVVKGLITEIEAIFRIQNGTENVVSNWPD
ncbi:MAG: hypothetical protein CMG46_10800 [Candidatus Marinimicrobia bacterium]|nr:hypothetical protein [Candidatus Neomarinimicrobiota bacterium]